MFVMKQYENEVTFRRLKNLQGSDLKKGWFISVVVADGIIVGVVRRLKRPSQRFYTAQSL